MKQVILSFFGVMLCTGCGNPPEYKYQKAADPVALSEVKTREAASATTESNTESTAAKTESGEPAMPEILVADLLKNGKAYDGKTVKVTGRIGKIFTHNKMAFLLNTKNDDYLELSYGHLSESDTTAIMKLVPLARISVSGSWDAGKKVFIADQLM